MTWFLQKLFAKNLERNRKIFRNLTFLTLKKQKMKRKLEDAVELDSKRQVETGKREKIILSDLIGSPFFSTTEESKNQLEKKRWKDYKTFFSRSRIPLQVDHTFLYSWKKENRYSSLESRQLSHLAQKGDLWLKRRKKVITGSRIGNILGFWGVDGLIQVFYDTYMDCINPNQTCNPREEEISNLKKNENFDWGNFHEIDGAATFMNLFGKAHNLQAEESTLTDIPWHLEKELFDLIKKLAVQKFNRTWNEEEEIFWKNWFRDSPDLQGIFLNEKELKRWVLEIKCKYGLREPSVYDHIPDYYIPQVQAHALAIQCQGTYFLSWSPNHTNIWYVPKDMEFWYLAMENLMWFHLQGVEGVPPTTLYSEELTNKIKKHCQMLCEKAEKNIICHTQSIYSLERSM